MALVQQIGSFAGLCAILGLAVLAALYMSQARELRRVRERLEESSTSESPQTPSGATVYPKDDPSSGRADYVAQPTERIGADQAQAARQPSDTENRLQTSSIASHRTGVRAAGVVLRIGGLAVLCGVIALAVLQTAETPKKGPVPRSTAVVAAPAPTEGVRVAVLNASSTPGLGGRMSTQAQGTGIRVVRVDDIQRRSTSVIMYRPGAQAAANEVSKRLGIAKTAPVDATTSSMGSDAAVIALIGSDKKGT
jgi:LytR cell envelope-related transcriptional attenuator